MTVSLTINGTSYDYPETGDLSWGPDATEWAQAVTSGMLQKAGGTFQLLADVNFGTTYGLLSQYYKTRTANIADAGQFRLARADVISWRNQANSANLDLSVDASNNLLFNGSAIGNIITVSDTATIDLTIIANDLTAGIVAGSIDNSMISAAAAIAFSKLATLTSGNILVGSAGNVVTSVAMSGDVAIVASGATTIQNSAVTNAKLANMNNITFKGNISGGAAAPSDLTATQVTANLDVMTGAGGTGLKGLVPSQVAGDATKFLRGDGVWEVPAGAGDVVGPASATDNGFVRFDGTTGKLIKDSAATIANADVAAAAAIARSKLASGNNYRVVTNGATGVMEDAAAITAARALISDANGIPTHATTTATEIGYVNGVTSAIQTQLDAKQLRSVLTTKGDLYAASASNTTDRLAAGTNGYVLKANSGQTLGLEYGVPQNSSDALINLELAASVAASALTIAIKTSAGTDASATDPIFIGFGDATLANGNFSIVSLAAALGITIPSTATMGQSSGIEADIYVYAINSAGTIKIGVAGIQLDETLLHSSVAIGTGSDSSNVLYSDAIYSNIRIRCIGRARNTQATAGTWATAPSNLSLQPLPVEFVGCAYSSNSGQNIEDTTPEVILFEDKEYDSHNAYDTTTGLWTAPVACKVAASALLTLAATGQFSGTEIWDVRIYKNGSEIKRFQTSPNSSVAVKPVSIYAEVNLAKGDTIAFWARQNSSITLNLESSTNAFNYMSIHKIG